MDAVGVPDEVVVQPVVALLPRELPQGHVAHPWDGNNQISLLVCWLRFYLAGLSAERQLPWLSCHGNSEGGICVLKKSADKMCQSLIV